MNKIYLIGNSGSKAELKYTQSQMAIINLSLAVSESKKNAQDVWETSTTWVPCVLFGRRAEVMAPLIQKGSKLFISGKLTIREVEKDGQKRTYTSVMVDEIQVIERPQKTIPEHPVQTPFSMQMTQQMQQEPQKPQMPSFGFPSIQDEDIPF